MQNFSRVCVKNKFYCIQQVNMSWVIYDFSHMFICLLWFCHGLPKGEVVRTYVVHVLRTHVMILCNWLIFWENALYLYLGRSRMWFNTLRNCVLRSSVEIIKSVQETSEEVLSFQNSIASRHLSTARLSIEPLKVFLITISTPSW